MSAPTKSRPSFSTASRWGIGLDMAVRTLLMVAVVVMVNYLGAKFSHRFYLSSQTQVKLSPRTLNVLRTLTNNVTVTLLYDRREEFYPSIVALLNEYRAANSKISIRTVDYLSNPGEAEKIKAQYQLTGAEVKDRVIFDCNGRVKVFPGATLTQYKTVQVQSKNPDQKELEFERRPVQFNGEMAFTSVLLALANPQPLKAYFVQGHGEAALTDAGEIGYQKFAAVLQQNYVSVAPLTTLGSQDVPSDCNLLVIAGPSKAFSEPELQRLDQYLREGGRLLALLGYTSQTHATGLEPILQLWGINVLNDIAQDPNHTMSKGYDVVVDQFGKHPAVDSLAQVQLQIYLPRPVIKMSLPNAPANAPEVSELFATSAEATLLSDRAEPPHAYPLACASEQKPLAGTINPRGTARLIVVGDSIFLGNKLIEAGGNRDFLNNSLNWLLDRSQLIAGIGPRPVTEFRLLITQQQQQQLRWLLLGALPGGILLLGWLVWFIRRK